jgi:hypothetical protein
MTLICVHLVRDQPRTGTIGVVLQGRRHRPPSRTKLLPAESFSSSHPGGRQCWASPLAFGLIGCTSPSPPPPNTYTDCCVLQSWYFYTLKEPMNRFQGIDSASLYVAWRSGTTTLFPRFLAPIDCSKIPARNTCI